MIDILRALGLAWERMIAILFDISDGAVKWPVLGFNAFLVMLGEGNIQFNKPVSFAPQKPPTWSNEALSATLPAKIHLMKQWLGSISSLSAGWTIIWYLFLIVAYIVGWLVLFWVGSRGQFLFIDNIVRNRAAIAEPWHRYAREGNVWFLFDLCLMILTFILMILTAGLFLLVGWAWIAQERDPQGGELATLGVFLLVCFAFWWVVTALLFIVRSFTPP